MVENISYALCEDRAEKMCRFDSCRLHLLDDWWINLALGVAVGYRESHYVVSGPAHYNLLVVQQLFFCNHRPLS